MHKSLVMLNKVNGSAFEGLSAFAQCAVRQNVATTMSPFGTSLSVSALHGGRQFGMCFHSSDSVMVLPQVGVPNLYL